MTQNSLRLTRSNVDHTVAVLTMKLEGPRPVWKPGEVAQKGLVKPSDCIGPKEIKELSHRSVL